MGVVSYVRRAASDMVTRKTSAGRHGLAASALRRMTGRSDRSVPAWWFTGRANFGDLLSPVILESICEVTPVRVSVEFRGKLLGAGSIAKYARPSDTVWGSGLIEPVEFFAEGVQFNAVRGPRTRSFIRGDVPEVYGDPGLLMPLIYQPEGRGLSYDVGLIPHYKDKDVMTSDDPRVTVVDIEQRDWRSTIDRMVSCDVVVSSSLHGILVAEAYGVPAVWVQPTERLKGGEFKFHDYYEGTDREGGVASWDAGLNDVVSRAVPPPAFDLERLLDSRPRVG